jgi:hypothetical protein
LQEMDCSDWIINPIRIVNVPFEIVSDVATNLKTLYEVLPILRGARGKSSFSVSFVLKIWVIRIKIWNLDSQIERDFNAVYHIHIYYTYIVWRFLPFKYYKENIFVDMFCNYIKVVFIMEYSFINCRVFN